MKNIKYNLASDTWGNEEIEAINEVIASNRYTMGDRVKKFETEFAKFFGSKYSIMVNSGSSANLLMIASLFLSDDHDININDEIIVPSVSWSTTYYPVSQYNLKLVFVDINKQTLNIDVDKIKQAITNKTKAIFAVNLLGNPCDMKKLKEICSEYNLILIEDNCESLGAKYENKYTGTFGIMGSFSFFFSHHMQTMEGGMILTNDKKLYELCLSLRAHGWIRDLPKENSILEKTGNNFKDSFNFVTPGYSIRPLEMSGAIGSVQLKKLPHFLEKRKLNAKFFSNIFKSEKNFLVQEEIHNSSWFGFSLVLIDKLEGCRDEIVNLLIKNNIECRPIVAGDFTKNPVIKYLNHRISGELTNTNIIDTNGFFVGNDSRDLTEEITFLHKVLKNYESNLNK